MRTGRSKQPGSDSFEDIQPLLTKEGDITDGVQERERGENFSDDRAILRAREFYSLGVICWMFIVDRAWQRQNSESYTQPSTSQALAARWVPPISPFTRLPSTQSHQRQSQQTMSESESDQTIELNYDNWYLWEHHIYIMSTILRKNAYLAFDPQPVDPRAQQLSNPPSTTPSVTITPQPTSEELTTYREELQEWKAANNIAAGIILGAISDGVRHVIDLKDPAKVMYDKLKAEVAEVVRQSSNSIANWIRIELINKKFKDKPTMDAFEKHLTFYRSKNATLNAVGAGIDDSLLAWLLLNSFSSNEDPIWSILLTNIITSGTPMNQWSFNHVAGKLREVIRHNIRLAETPTPRTGQTSLNAAGSKPMPSRYNGPPCTYPNCRRPKSHPTEDCWTKEKEKQGKENGKKHKARR